MQDPIVYCWKLRSIVVSKIDTVSIATFGFKGRNVLHKSILSTSASIPYQQASRIESNVGFKVMSKDSLYTGSCDQS